MMNQETINETVVRAYEDFPLLMPRWGYVVSAFILFLIGFFGFFLNLMVVLLMFQDRQLWTPLNIILFNLVCSDLSVSLLGNPFTLISALFHEWVFGKTMCVLYGFFMALLGITSITSLTVLSFERYMMVTRPLCAKHLSSRGAVYSIIFIWTYSLALTTPPLLGWGNYANEAANISCSVNWHEQSRNTMTYILFLFAMGQILPMGVITYSYVNIIRTIRRNSLRMGRVGKAESRVTVMVFVMIIAFTIAWTPYSIFALIEQFAEKGMISPGAGVIPALIAKSSICYDPLIYVGMNTQFRQSIKRLFGIHGKERLSHADKGYNTTLSHFPKITNELNSKCNSLETNNMLTLAQRGQRDKTLKDQNLASILKNKKELSTIPEGRSSQDQEMSGDTICEYDNNFTNNLYDDEQNSPTLRFVDNEVLEFHIDVSNPKDKKAKYYGNEGFEDHNSDIIPDDSKDTSKGTSKIKQSFSFELGGIPKEKKRKMSAETKIDGFFNNKIFIKSTITNKGFNDEDTYEATDNCKTYLCSARDISKDDDQYLV